MQAFLITKSNKMDEITSIIIFSIVSIFTGVSIGIFLQRAKNNRQRVTAINEAKEIVDQAKREAERIKSEKLLQAKERFIELKSDHEKVIFQREKKASDIEIQIREKENKLSNDLNRNKNLSQSLQQKEDLLQKRLDKLEIRQNELDEKIKKKF